MSPIATDLNVRDNLKTMTVDEIVDLQKSISLPYAVAIINVNGDLNIGVAMRSAVLFGAERFIMFGKKRYDKRSSVGAHNYIDVVHVECELIGHEVARDIFDATMVEYGYTPIFIECGGTNINSFDFTSVGQPCLIFGNEGYGLSEEFIGEDCRVSIEMRGVMRSFNVSAAASIACHVVSTQLSLS